VPQARVGDEQPVVVVHRQTNNAGKVGVDAVLDHVYVPRLRVENEHRANFAVRHVQLTF
jgi:hypothetical protein